MSDGTQDKVDNLNDIAGPGDLFGKPSVRRFMVTDPLPVNGKKCRLRSLTEREVAAYLNQAMKPSGTGLKADKMKSATRRLIAKCLVDKDGQPFVTHAQFEEMTEWDYADIQHLYDAAAKHVGLNTDDIESLVKNSEEIPEDA